MLTIRFHYDKRNTSGEIEVDAPYEVVADYLRSDIQETTSARKLIERLRSFQRGEHEEIAFDGNAYVVEAKKGTPTAHISCLHDESVSVELPIEWLIDAAEKWSAFIERKI